VSDVVLYRLFAPVSNVGTGMCSFSIYLVSVSTCLLLSDNCELTRLFSKIYLNPIGYLAAYGRSILILAGKNFFFRYFFYSSI
jgi:hypothetical protein